MGNNRLLNSVARRFKGVPQDYMCWAHNEQGQPLPCLQATPSPAVHSSSKLGVAPLMAWFKAFMTSGRRALLWLAAVMKKLRHFPSKLISPPSDDKPQFGV